MIPSFDSLGSLWLGVSLWLDISIVWLLPIMGVLSTLAMAWAVNLPQKRQHWR